MEKVRINLTPQVKEFMEKHHDQNISFSEKVVSHTFIDELGKVVSSIYAEIQRWKQTTTNIDKPLSKLVDT